jgi:hypothetical protein
MTGIIVLAVVIINEAVKRWDDRRIQRRAAAMVDEKLANEKKVGAAS